MTTNKGIDRLQPALLDRLRDDHPEQRVEPAEAHDRITTRVPLGRYVATAEVAAMVRYLAADTAAAVTAQALNVCGGLGNY